MPGWLAPARQNFCRSNALGMPLISIMPGQLPELKGGAWFSWPSISISAVPL